MSYLAKLNDMSIPEKVGQIFYLAFAKDRLDEARILFEENLVGGAYISNDNIPTPQAAVQLTQELQSYARETRLQIPLLLGGDQEGAWGIMVPHSCTGPGNMALGATHNPQAAYDMYHILGKELAAVGLNILLAPCADCNSNPENAIIGMRAFGEFPEQVGAMTAAAVRGTQDAGVIATVKHFPGHGDTTVDSHRGLATVNRSREDLFAIDLHPFKEGIDAGVRIVMTAHILFPALDPEHPATLSRIILQDVLRDELGFDGLILSDSMNMKAMKANYAPLDSAIQAINAGVDLVMLAEEHYDHNAEEYLASQQALIQGVIAAVEQGTIPMARVDDAVTRVLKLKDEFAIQDKIELPDKAAEQIGNAENRQVELAVSRQAIAVLRDKSGALPLDPNTPIALVNTTHQASYEILPETRGIGPNQTKAAFAYFAEAMQAKFSGITLYRAETILDGAEPAEQTIIAVTENYPLPGVDFDKSTQVQVIENLQQIAGKTLIVVALRDPYELPQLPAVKTYICSFSFRPSAAQAMVDVLCGAVEATGKSPVS